MSKILLALVFCSLLPFSIATRAVPRDTDGALITLSSAAQTVFQRGGAANFLVSRVGGITGAKSVSYRTADDTALAGVDYAAASGTLTWAAGDVADKTISVRLVPSSVGTGERAFRLTLSDAALGDVPEAVVTIQNEYVEPLTLPGFDWSTWSLTLPVDQYRRAEPSAKAWTIQPKDLIAGFADDFFSVSTALNNDSVPEVVFVTPANGAVTSPGSSDGSDHTRSELREMWVGGDSKGDWTSAVGGTLRGACRVLSVAPSTTEATFAQIHGQDFAFVLVDYRTTKQTIEIAVYAANAAGQSKKSTTVKKGVQLGDLIEYELSFVGNNVTVSVTGAAPLSVQVDESWVGAPVYFKAGAYHAAPNKGNAEGDETIVAYRELDISH